MLKESGTDNVCISPVSILSNLCLISKSTNDEVSTNIYERLGNKDINELKDLYKGITDRIGNNKDLYIIIVCGRINQLNTLVAENLRNYYEVDIHEYESSEPGSIINSSINELVKNKTNGLISEYIGKNEDFDTFQLINLIYY